MKRSNVSFHLSTSSQTEGDKMAGPHQNQRVASAGESLEDASVAVMLVHGRGATALSILQFAREFERDGVAYLAPQAAGNTWYPQSFLAPVEQNEPGRSSGLQRLGGLLERANTAGIDSSTVLFCGFSQGACLASEFVARNPRRYGGLAALSGGLIGEDIDPEEYEGDLAGTPVFLGCSDVDPHIPEERVHETATVFEQLNAAVDTRIYPSMGHTVNEDELSAVTSMLGDVLDTANS